MQWFELWVKLAGIFFLFNERPFLLERKTERQSLIIPVGTFGRYFLENE